MVDILLQATADPSTWDEVEDWLLDHGITIAAIAAFALVAVAALNRGIPRAVRLGTERRLTGKPREEIEQRVDTLTHVFTRSGTLLLLLLGFFTILPELGINIAPLLAGVGIVGIAVGFGAQSMVRDFLAGLFILMDNQYGKGDVVRIADISGLVEDVGLRRTVLRDLDGIVHYVPNGEIKVASNLTQEYSRVNLNVEVSYDEDLDDVTEVINRVGQEMAQDPKWADVLLTPPQGLEWKYEWPPLVPTIAEFKKNGMPRGFIEKAIPHQKRINVAWALSIAYNSHAIKSPLVIQTQDGTFDVANAEKQSQFGGIFVLKHGETPIAMNVVPNVNLHAIEEGREAKGDMDFAVSASEPVLRGQSDATSSGIKVATLQSAAVGPLNKWLQAFRVSEIEITRRLLPMILDHFTIERIQRIVGDDLFMRVMTATPPQHNVADYDVVATDQSISDLNKQQSFNAASALHQMGFIMDAKYMIMNAPIKNPDEALASHERAEADVVRMLLAENEMLKAQVGEMKKMIPRGGGGQAANAQRGKNQPQAGKRSMIGGTSPLTQVST